MTDASENIAYRYCLRCGTILEPDTNGPCECGPSSAIIARLVRRTMKMRQMSATDLLFVGAVWQLPLLAAIAFAGWCLGRAWP